MAKRSQRPFSEEVPRLLEKREMSLRQLAREVGVAHSHLSRLLRGVGYRTKPSMELARRVALAFGLPEDYFPEYREASITEAVRSRPGLRDELYDRLARGRRHGGGSQRA